MKDNEMTLADLREAQVYTPKQIAAMLNVKPRRIADAYRDGEIAGVELGPRTIRITGQAVKEWLAVKRSPTSSGGSGDQAKTSLTDNGVSMSSDQMTVKKSTHVKDIVLRSL